MEDEIEYQWTKNSEAYADLINGEGTPHHRSILLPCIQRLIGNVSGKTLLDAGCGEGYLSRTFARKGASVTSVDISKKLIEKSTELAKDEGLPIEHHVADICDLRMLIDASYDIVLSNLVLLNVPCLNKALREFYRVLKPGGRVVFSIVHPAFNIYGPGRWELGEKDPTSRRREGIHFIVDNYFDERPYQRYWRTRSGEQFPEPITFFHRAISTYFNSARNAGFVVDRIEEPLPESDDGFFDRERRIPIFLVFRLEKPQ